MAKASSYTKKCRAAVIILTILSFLLMVGPAAFYLATGLAVAEGAEALVITASAAIAVIFTLICAVRKVACKSLPWLIMLALFLVLDHLLVMVVVFAATQIIDELIVCPLLAHYKTALIANKAIDKRGI